MAQKGNTTNKNKQFLHEDIKTINKSLSTFSHNVKLNAQMT